MAVLLLFLACQNAGGEAVEPVADPVLIAVDCSSAQLHLTEDAGTVMHRDGHELHISWLIADQPELRRTGDAPPEALLAYRSTARDRLPDVSPLGLIRANRVENAWLERDHPAEARINQMVEGGVGTHRPMNCLETQILAFQARRFPLYEQPTEIVALILARTDEPGDLVKVYAAADDDSVVPKPNLAVAATEIDVAEGWRFVAVFHNHTFGHDPERGLFPVASPSASDLQISVALADRLGLESILVTDGFSTLELTASEFRRLAAAATGG